MKNKIKVIMAIILLGGVIACSSDDNSTIEENDDSKENEIVDIKIEVKLKGMFMGWFNIEEYGIEEGIGIRKIESVKIGADYPDAHIREFYIDSTFIIEDNFNTLDSYFNVYLHFQNHRMLNNPEWEEWESSRISITTEREGKRETVLDTLFTKEEHSFMHHEYIYQ